MRRRQKIVVVDKGLATDEGILDQIASTKAQAKSDLEYLEREAQGLRMEKLKAAWGGTKQ